MSTSAPANPKQWDHGLRRQVLVESLLKEIVNGRIRSGEHLVTQSLARRFGVSHTPVREALVMLAGMGLVDVTPNRGAIVRKVTAHGVREICQVRSALECEAVRLACGRIEARALERLRSDLRQLTEVESTDRRKFIARARAVDSRLHDVIAGSCGNSFLAHELGRLKDLFRAFRDAAWDHSESNNDLHRLAAESSEHLEIVDALLAGNRPAAVRAMAGHIASGMTYWCRAIPEAASDDRQNAPDRAEGERR